MSRKHRLDPVKPTGPRLPTHEAKGSGGQPDSATFVAWLAQWDLIGFRF